MLLLHAKTRTNGYLFQTIESSGIQLNDPRLRESMLKLTQWEKDFLESEATGKSPNSLDKEAFFEYVKAVVYLLF